MDPDYSTSHRDCRSRARTWLAANTPRKPRPSGEEGAAYDCAWQRKQYDGGFAGVSWPAEHGGLGLSAVQQMIWYEECVRAGAPGLGANPIGLTHAGSTLIMCGTDAQRTFHLPKILRGEVIW